MDKSQINLLNLIGSDSSLKRVASTNGGEYAGPCPRCGGKDRFHVQPYRPSGGLWFCRQCHEQWSDAIEYLRWRDSLGFPEALQALGLETEGRYQPPKRKRQPKRPTPKVSHWDTLALSSDDWQSYAALFVESAQETLWSKQGSAALAYLIGRGLHPDTIRAWSLGFHPRRWPTTWGEDEVHLPQGIVIPWLIRDRYWKVNIRLLNGGDMRYVQVKGGANGLFNVSSIEQDSIVVMVEGEFDAMLLWQETCDTVVKGSRIIPVATGSSTGAQLQRWLAHVDMAKHVVLLFDADDAGEKASDWWSQHLRSRTVRLRPSHKDITDMWKAGVDIAARLRQHLERRM